jgi:hypothetical protein
MSKLAKALTAAAGNAGESLYVEDVFSTYLYTGNGSTQTITNGIDLDGEGGMVWKKQREAVSGGFSHNVLADTERGAANAIFSDLTDPQYSLNPITSFNSDGFSVTDNNSAGLNLSGKKYASWTFRKAEKFFDVVTYTGDETSGRQIAHNLGATPAVMIVKKTSGSYNWQIYHSSIGATKFLEFTDYFAQTSSAVWNDTAPTDSVFTVGNEYGVNQSGDTYVAYLFASDAGGFGDDGSESIIKCGSFTTDGSGLFSVTLGFEPQWILVKRTSGTGNWFLVDAMRGLTAAGIDDALLLPNSSSVEIDSNWFDVTATGFNSTSSNPDYNSDYIYIAIRRPMKTPESGTEVFAPVNRTATAPTYNTGFVTDMQIMTLLNGFQNQLTDRLRGQKKLLTNATDAESAIGTEATYDWMTGVGDQDSASSNNIAWNFKRATGFFDVVAYTGDGVAGRTVAHNLGVAPELMIFKNRSQTGDNWVVYSDVFSPANYLKLNNDSYAVPDSANLRFNNTAPTESVFTVGTSIETNWNGQTYISYHFATLAGVSKVGSYTGTGADLNVDCGFSAGARFILIKRSDSGGTGDWYVWDSERGIVAGNDPYLLLNSTAAEVTNTDYIDPLSSGFTVTSSAPAALNASGGTYIFLAIS